jgi:hypothetical protein
MDFSQTLRYKVLVERKGYAFFVDLDYENIPEFCNHCVMVGHNVDDCRKLHYQEIENKTAEPKKKNIPRPEKRYVQTRVGNVEKTTAVMEAPVASNKSQSVNVVDCSENSPKARPAEPNMCLAAVEHQNQFNILANELGDNVELTHQNKSPLEVSSPASVEVPVNVLTEGQASSQQDGVVEEVGDSDNSSQDTDFVDATQFQKEDNLETVIQPISTPERVQKDMMFLKDSWANMAELEEQDVLQDPVMEAQTTKEDGFQIKLTKNQKRAQKKVTQSSKDSYATRSRVSQKPFK